MLSRTHGALVATVLCCTSCSLFTVRDDGPKDPGFTQAAFDRTAFERLINDPETARIRFYNVARDENDPLYTVMAVPVDLMGRELEGDGDGYLISDKIQGDQVVINAVNADRALYSCRCLIDDGHWDYSTELDKKVVAALLEADKANAILIKPVEWRKNAMTMTFAPARISSGRISTVGTAISCALPCPEDCVTPGTFKCPVDRNRS